MQLAGERRRKRLDVYEIASVRTRLLLCLVRGLRVMVIVLFLFRRGFSCRSVAGESDLRGPLREVLDGDRRPIFRQGEAKPAFHAAPGARMAGCQARQIEG